MNKRLAICFFALMLILVPMISFAGNKQAMFELSLTFAIEQDLPTANPLDMVLPDPTYSFLRDQADMNEDEIAQMAADAENFFLERFGLDFTNVVADENGIKWTDSAMFFPYRFADHVEYRIVSASNALLKHSPRINDGGFIVMTTGPVTYYGTFGGESGKQGFPGEMLPYALYKIDDLTGPNGKKPLIISARAAGPMRTNIDGDTSINCEVIHPTLGAGNAEGVFKFRPNLDGSMRIGARNVLTFPAR